MLVPAVMASAYLNWTAAKEIRPALLQSDGFIVMSGVYGNDVQYSKLEYVAKKS